MGRVLHGGAERGEGQVPVRVPPQLPAGEQLPEQAGGLAELLGAADVRRDLLQRRCKLRVRGRPCGAPFSTGHYRGCMQQHCIAFTSLAKE